MVQDRVRLLNKGEFDKALNAFKKVIDWANGYKDQPGSSKLADAARKDTIPVYALKGDPAAAYNFFKGTRRRRWLQRQDVPDDG
ncbi:MAG: hypothetical protein U0235_21025 [Polyangiaceae bacterium]